MGDHLYARKIKKSGRGPTLPPGWEVPSALPGVTAVFGMGTGGAPALGPPAQNQIQYVNRWSST